MNSVTYSLLQLSIVSERQNSLEEALGSLPALQSQLSDLQQERDTLLELVGEKTEEIECMRQDLAEVKSMYQTEIKELMDRIAPV